MTNLKASNTNPQWREAGQRLKQGQKPGGKKAIGDMNLEEALDAEEKYLVWNARFPDHEDHEVKAHIYQTYLLPRISFLKQEREVSMALGISEPVKTLEDQQLF
jgi:hypothetical protein